MKPITNTSELVGKVIVACEKLRSSDAIGLAFSDGTFCAIGYCRGYYDEVDTEFEDELDVHDRNILGILTDEELKKVLSNRAKAAKAAQTRHEIALLKQLVEKYHSKVVSI